MCQANWLSAMYQNKEAETSRMKNGNDCLRVLHVIGSMNLGGAETLIMNLYRNIDRDKIQFDIVVHTTEKMYFSDEILKLGGNIYCAPSFMGLNIYKYKEWWNNFFLEHPEYKIVHGHIGSTASIYLKIAKKYGRFTIAHSHNTNGKMSFLELMFRIATYSTRYIADEFFGCSTEAGIDRYGVKIARSKRFNVIHNGIDVEKYVFSCERRKCARTELGINNDVVVWGHVGRFALQKNHKQLIEIFYEYHKVHCDSILLLFGEGPEREKIKRLTEKLAIADSVKFMGLSNRIDYFMQAMDLFVFPSIYEGLGISVVEAQTSGLPCITSDAIVDEADIGAGLIKKMPLSAGASYWVSAAETMLKKTRKDTSQYAINAGYDIKEVAQKLQNYYLEKSSKS